MPRPWKPLFFVTFTCNIRWPEIQGYMDAFPHLTAADRPDVVDRVFERKIHDLIRFVRDGRTFGSISAGNTTTARIVSVTFFSYVLVINAAFSNIFHGKFPAQFYTQLNSRSVGYRIVIYFYGMLKPPVLPQQLTLTGMCLQSCRTRRTTQKVFELCRNL